MNSRIVMIDDDEEEALLFQYSLKAWRPTMELIWYESAQSFLENAEAKPQLILLDYSLPGQTGLEWLKTFLTHPCCEGVPVVLFTGNESVEHQQEALRAGAAGYLLKPGSQQAIKQAIETLEQTWLRPNGN